MRFSMGDSSGENRDLAPFENLDKENKNCGKPEVSSLISIIQIYYSIN